MCITKNELSCKVYALDLGHEFVPHGDMDNLYRRSGLDSESITKYVCEVLRHEN